MDKYLSPSGGDLADQKNLFGSASVAEMIDHAVGLIRRQYPVIVYIVACAIALGFVYLFTAQKQYTAHASLLMDAEKVRVLQQQQQVYGDQSLDTAQVETQIELLKSEAIGLSVVKDLKLTENPEFVGSQTGIIGAIFGLISRPFTTETASSRSLASEFALTRQALGRFMGGRNIRRVARTYVLDISFTAANPGTAATVANAIADAYILDQLDSKYQATRRASVWLQDRINELRQQAMTADRAVLEFKEQKKIIGTGGGGGDGRLLGEQQVLDLSGQLATTRVNKAEAKARLDRIAEVMNQDVPDATVADSLRNEIINHLRSQYLEYDRRHNLYAARYGENHLAVVNLRTQMLQLRKSMRDELGRIAESYKSDYEIAVAREESLEKSLSQLISGAELTNRERLGLQDLESKAKVFHSIYDNFLQRYMEMAQQQSFPITEARVITAATPPGGSSSPNTSRTLTIAGFLGLLLGGAAAVFRELIDRVFRTTRQVESILRTNCLAVLPIVKDSKSAVIPPKPARKAPIKIAAGPKSFDQDLPRIFRQVIHEPLSAFAEGLRSVKVAADISNAIKENKVIGVTSSLPHEGKSTVAVNMAELIADSGSKAILVDGDLRNPTLSRKLVVDADVGLLQVLGGKADLRQAIYIDEFSGLAFLPAVVEAHLAHSSEILGSEAFRQLVDGLSKTYDYVIIDLPPLAPVVDVRATTKIIDSYVFVIQWGKTRLNIVEHQFRAMPEVTERMLGVVLNKADFKALDRYENYYGRYYHKKHYSRYGYTQ